MKQKEVAVALAIIFGFFTWLYTYKIDYWKFWMCLVLVSILSIFAYKTYFMYPFFWLWPVADVISREKKWYMNH